jgi:hypothetical protein
MNTTITQPITNIRQVGLSGSAAVVYNDLATSPFTVANGATAPSDRTYAFGIGSGVAFPVKGFKNNDYVWFSVQSSHSMKLSTLLDCHIHYCLPDTTTIGHKIKFQLDVVAAPINGAAAVPTGSPYSVEFAVAADDNTKFRVAVVADIAAVNTTVSTIYFMKLTRIASAATEYAGEVYLLGVDCHYQQDTVGSLSQGTKV